MEEKKKSEKSTNSGVIKRKREEKGRKKDPRLWDNIIKSVLNLSETEKMEIIEKKYNELYHEIKNLEIQNQQHEKQRINLQKEQDHVQSELTKSVLARSRLEDLCRELQKQNKLIKEENLVKIKEAEDRRKEVALKFAVRLNEINNIMEETKETSGKLREENINMTTKLTELYNDFQEREHDITKMSYQMEIERQYSQATLTKMEMEIKSEREIWSKERALIQKNLEKSEANCRLLQATSKGLEEQIDVYKAQYSDFENTMNKSSKAFDTFKSEMSKMAKQIVTLEKESKLWKMKYKNSTKTIIDLSEMKQLQLKTIHTDEKKINQLQKLCRQLQTDRASFLQLLKINNITPTTQDCSQIKENEEQSNDNIDNNCEPNSTTSTPKLTKKEKKLKMLKNEMKAYQDELNKYLSQEESQSSCETQNNSDESINQKMSELELNDETETKSTDNEVAKTDSVQTELETPNKQE